MISVPLLSIQHLYVIKSGNRPTRKYCQSKSLSNYTLSFCIEREKVSDVCPHVLFLREGRAEFLNLYSFKVFMEYSLQAYMYVLISTCSTEFRPYGFTQCLNGIKKCGCVRKKFSTDPRGDLNRVDVEQISGDLVSSARLWCLNHCCFK